MRRRMFLHALGLGALALAAPTPVTARDRRHWAWLHARTDEPADDLRRRFAGLREAGIAGVLVGGRHPQAYALARAAGLEVHAWYWTLCRGDLAGTLPHCYAVNRLGQSTLDQPPYVDYYRFLCPSRPEVRAQLSTEVATLAADEDLAGVHLDYVRYPDVILPRGLWEKYGLVQEQELPTFDYCYCDVCRRTCHERTGIDPSTLDDPTASAAWRRYRWDSITELVNHLAGVVHAGGKRLTAAVFPTPALARELVRQDWTRWRLDAVLPMVYHGFYRQDIAWIEDAVREGVTALDGRFPLYAGLYLPSLASESDQARAVRHALAGGADGVALFGGVRNLADL